MSTYRNGTVTATTTASILGSPGYGGLMIQNNGAVAIYIGGPNVTADQTANGGLTVAAGATLEVPSTGSGNTDLYVRTASGTAPVAWLSL